MKEEKNLMDEVVSLMMTYPVVFLILGFSLIGSPLILPMCLPVVLLLRYHAHWQFVVIVISGLFVLWAVQHGDLPALFAHGAQYLRAYQDGHLDTALLWRDLRFSCPLGIFLGGLASLTMPEASALQHDLKRIGQGVSVPSSTHRARVLKKRLAQCEPHVIDDGAVMGINKDTLAPVILRDHDANLHVLAVGTTGSGKTTTLTNIVESAIFRGLPVFYVDGKGDRALAERMEAYATQCGRSFYLFSMMGDSCTYNPLCSGGFTSKKDRIIELRHWSEEHYKKLAESYLQMVLKFLDSIGYALNLTSLVKALNPDELMRLARQAHRQDMVPIITHLASLHKQVGGLIAELTNLVDSEIGHLFMADEESLILSRAFENNAVVYFCLQPLQFPSYASTLGKLIINDLKSLFSTQLSVNTPKKSYVFFDEFSVFAGEQIIHLINQGRSAGVHAVLATQSIADLEYHGGRAFVGQVLNNCNNYIIQRQNNPADADLLAQVIGTKKSFEVTSQITLDAPSQLGTAKEIHEFIYHPDVLKALPMGEAIFLTKQQVSIQAVLIKQGNI